MKLANLIDETYDCFMPKHAKPKRKVIPGVARSEEKRLKRKLRSKACSEPWVEAQIRYVEGEDEDGDRVLWAEHRKGVYPVTQGTPGMITCRGCERPTPPQCVGSSGHCDDCRLGAMGPIALSKLQGTTSTINLAKLKLGVRRGLPVIPGGI